MAGQRIVIGLEAGADGSAVREALLAAGAASVAIAPSQPDVAVVDLPIGHDQARFMEQARRLPGVRYVEPEAMRSTY